MSLTVESEIVSSAFIEENSFHWGEETPKDLQKEATLVSKLALELFQKLKVHPNVYVPSNKKKEHFKGEEDLETKDWCYFWWNNKNKEGQFGRIRVSRDITTQQGKKIEIPIIQITTLYGKNIPASPHVDHKSFNPNFVEASYDINMPQELQKEAGDLIKISSRFFRRLVEHPEVITVDGGANLNDWEKFSCYNQNSVLYRSICFSDGLLPIGKNRIQTLVISQHPL